MDGFRADITSPEGHLTLVLVGEAEAQQVAQLEQAVGELHARALGARASAVRVDLRGLAFATSSILKVLSSWVIQLVEEPAYRIVVLQGTYPWQRRSLAALGTLAIGVLEIVPAP